MTSEQVMDYTIKLEQEGKLKKDFSDKYYFEIDSQLGTKYKGNVFANYIR